MKNQESAIQKLILDWLLVKKYYHWRNYVGAVIRKDGNYGANPAKGMPDIMGLLKGTTGRLFAIEVKTPKGRVLPHQKERITALRENGVIAFVARDLETVIDTLKEFDEYVKRDGESLH